SAQPRLLVGSRARSSICSGPAARKIGARMAADFGEASWAETWREVARQLGVHRAAGRRHLLTEDTVRMCTVLALEEIGVAPRDLGIEVADPALGGGKIDLVVTWPEGRAVVELKYPRGSRSGISPDTMTLG